MDIYVSLTTIPSRFSGIFRTLDSLVEQTVRPTRIFLNIPRSYKRFPGASISEEACNALLLKYGAILETNYLDEDSGPGTKIVGITDYRLDRHAMFILADDDSWYKPDAIELVMNAVREDYFAGRCSAYSFFTYTAQGMTVGQGSDMFAIPNVCLSDIHHFFSVIKNQKSLFFHDDLWISFFLVKKKIPIKHLRYDGVIYERTTKVDGLVDLTGELERDFVTRSGLHILEELDRKNSFGFLERGFALKKS